MRENRRYVGDFAHLPRMRACGMLRQFQKQARHETFPSDEASDHAIRDARRRFCLVLRRFRISSAHEDLACAILTSGTGRVHTETSGSREGSMGSNSIDIGALTRELQAFSRVPEIVFCTFRPEDHFLLAVAFMSNGGNVDAVIVSARKILESIGSKFAPPITGCIVTLGKSDGCNIGQGDEYRLVYERGEVFHER